MQTINSKDDLSTVSDILTALQTIPGIPDFETPYSRTTFPNSNHCAIGLEDQSIRAIITERQHQLDNVLHDISGLQTVIHGIISLQDHLLKHKKRIIESINLHRRLVSPLWHFPTEVLSQIFCHFLSQVPKLGESLQPPSKLTVPMSLTRICRRWREVVMTCPTCGVCCLQPSATTLGSSEHRDMMTRPSYNVFFSLTPIKSNLSLPIFTIPANLNLIRSETSWHSRRCPCTSIWISLLVICQLIIYALSRNCRPLCAVSMYQGGHSTSGTCPSCNPVWAHLTTLGIGLWEAGTVLHLLQLAPNLSSLTIRILFFDGEALETVHTHKPPHLHIDCDYYDGETLDFCDLLDAFSFPTLRVLTVHDEFVAFLARLIVSGSVEYVALFPSLQFVLR
ncbi:hypothetical protein DFJ58DRAFT_824230 [Suillus subalutaceus]|uniref:uncharacterized protein n=1 Tax=Suillus subalutaceus TaxID=48586 RepID=UPI001B872075|nr:uncharacterized protein DFJ58DRAFT_824230 [Suillus subalutaceus]KAG1830972.1 hypothetical protein DFJ58DRAFT_824230 [Suillus subalutaceus]